ncbi:MAG: type II secretion system protein [Syntrophales bacterium]|nr:type II secretion system protein [Syntrophales bacterium]
MQKGFTLLEVMISLAIVGGLLLTLISSLNYHLGVAERQIVFTNITSLGKEKIYEMEKNPSASRGNFPEPYSRIHYETKVVNSSFPGMLEIWVTVSEGKEMMKLSEIIRKSP